MNGNSHVTRGLGVGDAQQRESRIGRRDGVSAAKL
jgi:hypothetical protein